MMVRSLVLSVVLLLVLSAAGCTATTKTTSTNTSTPGPAATPDAFPASRATYMKNCKEGHGGKGEGGPVKLADGTKLEVASLPEGHGLDHLHSHLLKRIPKGGDGR